MQTTSTSDKELAKGCKSVEDIQLLTRSLQCRLTDGFHNYFSLDIRPYKEFAERAALPSTLEFKIEQEGIKVYEQ